MKSLKRSRVPLPTLACWPQPWPELDDFWYIFNLQLKNDGKLDWFLRKPAEGPVFYKNLEEALKEVKNTNTTLIKVVDTLALSPDEKLSIKLKVEKTITAEERLMDEEGG